MHVQHQIFAVFLRILHRVRVGVGDRRFNAFQPGYDIDHCWFSYHSSTYMSTPALCAMRPWNLPLVRGLKNIICFGPLRASCRGTTQIRRI
jgi:hypothetical protein